MTDAAELSVRRAETRQRWIRIARQLAGFVVLFVAWEAGVRLFHIKEYVLPPPSQIFAATTGHWHAVAQGAWVTTLEIVAGYLLAVVVSIPLAVSIAFSRVVEQTVYPVMVFLQIMPKIAVAPLFIIWFGFGFTPKLLVVFLLSFFPIVISGIAGFRSIDPDIMDFVHTTGAKSWTSFVKVRLPSALPDIFVGLKVGAALSATAAVVAEFVASDRGLGYLLLQYNGDLNTQMVFAVIILLSAIGVIVYFAVELLQRIVIPWHASSTHGPGGIELT
jgi:NitT/TauT family transport system permease protein